jgi:formaldehyde-activating enzyme involved in methanogenesis
VPHKKSPFTITVPVANHIDSEKSATERNKILRYFYQAGKIAVASIAMNIKHYTLYFSTNRGQEISKVQVYSLTRLENVACFGEIWGSRISS